MTQASGTARSGSASIKSERLTLAILLGSFALIFIAVIGVVVWAAGRETAPPPVFDYEAYRPAWESAMAKAGVEATFPVVPVEIDTLETSGFRSLDATFTAEEISALAAMYRYTYESPQGTVSLLRPEIGFPEAGRVSVSARLVYQGSGYSVRGAVDATMASGALVFDEDSAVLVASGFQVEDEQLRQALGAVVIYIEELLTAAPRLTVLDAEIVEGAVHVYGAAPREIRDPRPPED